MHSSCRRGYAFYSPPRSWLRPQRSRKVLTIRRSSHHLVAAYPDQLERIDGSTLVWRDGTRMELDDGKGVKTFEAWLADPDIEDMLAVPYPAGGAASRARARTSIPGRARNLAFFDKMYGDCRKGEVAKNLTEIVWLPKKAQAASHGDEGQRRR